MAEVLATRVIEKTAPFTGGYSCVTYNDLIYINTKTAIYTYDAVNNLYALKVTKTTASTYAYCAIYSGKIYMMRIYPSVGSNHEMRLYIDVYDIESNTITYDNALLTFTLRYNRGYTLSNMNIIDDTIYLYMTATWGQYSYSNNYHFITYNITANTFGGNYSTNGSNYRPAEGQYTNNFYFGAKYWERWSGSGTIYYSNGYGILTESGYTQYGTWETTRAYASFIRGEKVYILGGVDRTQKITVYDVQSNSFADSDITLPFEVNGIECGNVNDDYYIFGSDRILKISFIDYDLTYKIANNSGEEEYRELTGQSPIIQTRFNYTIGGDVGFVFTTLSGTVSGTYTPNIPDGKKLIGFSSTPNATRAQFGLNVTSERLIEEDITFYEVYGKYRPPATTFDINLYQSSAEVNRVDKTDYLTSVGTLSGALREECSIIAPSITFRLTTVPTFNYVYIAAFGRYYYVTGITSVSKDIWRMALSCDVLMTWKDDIRALTAVIARQENSYNPLLLDSELPAQANQNITVTEFPAGGFNTSSDIACPFVLTVVGA